MPAWSLARARHASAAAALCFAAACDSPRPTTNPYDLDTPLDKQATGTLAGRVLAEAAFDDAKLDIVITGLSVHAAPIGPIAPERSFADGIASYTAKVPPGIFSVRASMKDGSFAPAERGGLTVAADKTVQVDDLLLVAGRGSLVGSVAASSPSAGQLPVPPDTRVTLLRLVSAIAAGTSGSGCVEPDPAETVSAQLSRDGTFRAANLAVGPYLVVAEADGFVPAATRGSVEVTLGEPADAGRLDLLHATEIVVPRGLERLESPRLGAWVTRSARVTLELSDLPLYNGVRISEDPLFADPTDGDTDFFERTLTREVEFAGGDGDHRLFVQFRAPTCRLSPVYASLPVILDTAAPFARPPALSTGAACTRTATVGLVLEGEDRFGGTDACPEGSCSGIAEMRLSLDGALDTETWQPFTRTRTETLAGEGEARLLLQLRDQAGNEGTDAQIAERVVVVNTQGPRVGTPALAIEGGAPVVTAANVLVDLNVEGAVRAQLGNAAGLGAAGWFDLPATGQAAWRLAEGPDGDRSVFVRYADDCGNVTPEYHADVRLDRSGWLAGQVTLEEGLAPAGAVATALVQRDGAWVAAADAVAADADGRFAVRGLAPGTYRVSLANEPFFVPQTTGELAVGPGAATQVPAVQLRQRRGALQGRALLQGERFHGGVRIATLPPGGAAETDATGAFVITGLPLRLNPWSVVAAPTSAFHGAASVAPIPVAEGEPATVTPDLVLRPVEGRIRGIAQLTGRAVHANVLVVLDGLTVGGAEFGDSTGTVDDGSFEFTGLTAGTYSLVLTSPGYRTQAPAPVILGPGGDADLGTVTLAPAVGRLSGTVELAGEVSQEGVKVVALRSGAPAADPVYTEASGQWRIASLPADSYELRFSKSGFGTRAQLAAVQADTETVVPKVVLARQVGEVALEGVDTATRLTTVRVVGEYPGGTEARVCEDPAKSGPADFTEQDCGFVALHYTGGSTRFDPVPLSFKPGPCPGASDPPAVCDGAKRIWVWIKNAAGEVSPPFPALEVVLDRRPPAGAVVIEPLASTFANGRVRDQGAAYTRSTSAAVLLVAADDATRAVAGAVSGVHEARLHRGAADQSPVIVSLTDGTKSVTGVLLGGSGDGARPLLLDLVDRAGNHSTTDLASVACPEPRATAVPTGCDAIFLDTTAPQALVFSVNPLQPNGDLSLGAPYAMAPLVQLGLDSTRSELAEDAAVEAVLANDPNFSSAIVQPLAEPKALLNWFLTPGDGTKTVYAKVRDRAGNLSGVFQDSIVLDTQSPDPPVLVPAGAWVRTRRPTLSFLAAAGADAYRLQLSRSALFEEAARLEVPLTETSWSAGTDLAEGARYYWRARSEDAAGHASAYASADTFTVDTLPPGQPTLDAPASPTRTSAPVLAWSAVAGAAAYEAWLDSSSDFPEATRTATTVAATSWKTQLLVDGTWHVRVRALDAAGNTGEWSATHAFVVDTDPPGNPVVSAPAAGALVATPTVTLSWGAVTGAARYVVQLGADAGLATYEEYLATATTRVVAPGDGTWTFRVGAEDAAGNRSNLSAAPLRTFTVDTSAPETPTLTFLPGLVNVRRPSFAWSSSEASGATSYQLRVDERTYAASGTTLAPAQDLADGSHSWTVAAVDAAGNRSPFAAAQAFQVDATAPAAPQLQAVSPSPGNNPRPTLAFSPVSDAATYRVEWDRTPTFTGADKGSALVEATSVQPVDALTDGTWHWQAFARDRAGNESAASVPGSFEIDLTAPPDAVLTAPTEGQTAATAAVTFAWAAVPGAATYRLELSGATDFAAAQQETTATTTRTLALADGAWHARVVALDAATNASPGAAVRAFTVDTTAPAVPEPQAVVSPTRETRPVLRWSDASASGAVSYRLVLDNAAHTTTGTSWTPVEALADGTHSFTVASVDAAGNASAPSAVQLFEVDSTPPGVPVLVAVAPDPTNLPAQTLRFGAVAGATSYAVQWDSSASFGSTDLSSAAVTAPEATTPALAEKTWYWHARAIDRAGNESAWSAHDSFVVDVTPPAAPELSTPADETLKASSTVTFSWAAAEGALTYLFDLSQSAVMATYDRSELTLRTRSATLADGDWYWRVLARDAAGNVSPAAGAVIRKVRVDTTPPAVPVPATISSPRNTVPTLSWGAVTGASSYELTLDGAATTVTTTSHTPGSLADGTHVWTVASLDAAGNRSAASSTQSFVLDTAPPAVPALVVYTPDPGSDATPTLQWQAVEDAAGYTVQWDTASSFEVAAVSQTTAATTLTVPALADGTWYWHVRASDSTGNASAWSTSDSFRVDTAAPVAPSPVTPANDSTSVVSAVSFSWSTVGDAASYRLQIGADSALATVNFDIASITGTSRQVTLADAIWYWRVLSVDDAGNQTAAAAGTISKVTVDATPPGTPTLSTVTTPTNDATPLFVWSDQSGSGATRYLLEIDGVSTTVTATSYAPSSNLADGSHTVRVAARDAAGNDSAWSPTQTFLVDTILPANPALSAPADNVLRTASTTTFSWDGVSDAAVYLFDLSQSAVMATYERSELTLALRSATLADGDWYWRVLARDAAGNVSPVATAAIRKVTVDTVAPAVPVPATIASPRSTVPTLSWGAVTGASSYEVTLDGTATTVTTTSHTPASLADGTHVWTVASLDAAGNRSAASSTQSFVLDTAPPAVPTLVAYTPDPTTDNTPAVEWQAVEGAASYTVQWASNEGFVSPSSAGTASTGAILGSLANGTWFWRVRSVDSTGNYSAWTAADSFLVDTTAPAAPTPLLPADEAVLTASAVTFSWTSPGGDVTSYRLQIGSDATLSTVNLDIPYIAGTSRQVTLGDAVWYWRVLATDAAGNQTATAQATVRSVTVDATPPGTPTLSTVTTPTNDATPAFAWSDQSGSGATGYVLAIDATETALTATTYTPSSNLAEGAHTVKVAAKDAAGNRSAWSPAQSFTVDTVAPDNALPASPADNTVTGNGTVTLTWGSVADAASYRLHIGTDPSLLVRDEHTVSGTTKVLSLTDGAWTWRVGTVDAAGNPSAISSASVRKVTVDTAAPDAPALTFLAGLVNTRRPTFAWSTPAGAVSYVLKVDGSTYTTTATSHTPAVDLDDGSHSWTAAALDAAGNQSAFAAPQAFQVDATAPGVPTLVPVSPDPGNNTQPTFAFSAVAGAATYTVEWSPASDFATKQTRVVATTSTQPTTTLADGTWYFRALATDAAGNSSAASTADSFVVDTAPPADGTLSAPTQNQTVATGAVSFQWGAVTGAASYRLEIAVASAGFSAPLVETTTATGKTVALTDGSWLARVIAVDAAGNASPGAAQRAFAVDTTPPEVPVPVALASPTNNRQPTLQWSDCSGSGATRYSVLLDAQTISVTATSYVPAALADGTHSFSVASVDAAGNTSARSAAQIFAVDATDPAVPVLVAVTPDPTNTSVQTLRFNTVPDATSYLVQWDDNSGFASPASQTVTTGQATTGVLADATWYWRVRAYDSAGNDSDWAVADDFAVDTTPPSAPVPSAPADQALRNAATVSFSWSEPAGAASYRFDLSTSSAMTSYERVTVLTTSRSVALPDGDWYWRVLAADAAGNLSTQASSPIRKVTVDTAAPGVPVPVAVASPRNTVPTLSWGAVSGASSYVVTLDGSTDTTAGTSYTPASLQDGTHAWTVAARDLAGNQSAASTTQSFDLDRAAPAAPVALPYAPDPTTDNTPQVAWNAASGAAGYEVEWDTSILFDSGTDYGTTTTASTAVLLGDTGLRNAVWHWHVRSLDAVGNASAWSTRDTFEIDTLAPPAPVLSTPAHGSTSTAAAVTFGWSPSTGAASYRLQIGPDSALSTVGVDVAGITATQREITLADGTWYWRVLATDGAGNQTVEGDAAIRQLTVDATLPATPTLATVATPTNDATPLFSWSDEAATGATGYVIKVDLAETSTSATSYSPSSDLAQGAHTVTVRSRDAAGNQSPWATTQAFTVDTGAPSVPGSLAPAADRTQASTTVAFSWDGATDTWSSVSYRLQIARASDFVSLVLDQTQAGTSASVVLTDGDYWWRVRAADAAGNTSNWAPNASGRKVTVDGTGPAVPVLVPVGALVSDATPQLTWTSSASTGAVGYDVRLDDSTDCASPLRVADVTTASHTPGTDLADAVWYWCVRAYDGVPAANGGPNRSAWTASDRFEVDATRPPAPGSPSPAANHLTNVPNVAFSWSAAADAVSYRLEIAYDAAFSAVAQLAVVAGTSKTLGFLDGTYYWRVFAVDDAGNVSATAAGNTAFRVDTVSPRRPLVANATGTLNRSQPTYALQWSDEADSGAVRYEYQVANNSAYSSPTVDGATDALSVTIARPASDGTWYWRVRARDAAGNASAWSTATVTVDTLDPSQPVPSSPTAHQRLNSGVVTMAWSAGTGASTYQLQIGQEPLFQNQVVVSTSTAQTSSYQSLSEDHYYWRVRAVDAVGNTSKDWGTGWSGTDASDFYVDVTLPRSTSFLPYPSSTSNSTNDTRPNLMWSPASDETSPTYEVTIADNSSFSSPAFTKTVAATQLLDGDFVQALGADDWYARVVVVDQAGNRSAPSPTISFVIDTDAPSAPSTCYLSPLAPYSAPAVSTANPVFYWSYVTDAASYNVLVYTRVGASWTGPVTLSGIATNGTAAVTFMLPDSAGLADGGRYLVGVNAVDAAGNVGSVKYCVAYGTNSTNFYVDRTAPPPIAGLSVTPASPTNSSTLVATWDGQSDSLTGGQHGYIARLYDANGVAVKTVNIDWWSSYVPGTRSTATFSSVSHGVYTVEVVAYDAARNPGTPPAASPPVTVDLLAPRQPVLYSPLGYKTASGVCKIAEGGRPTFQWSDESSDGAARYRVKVYCATSIGNVTTCPSATSTLYYDSSTDTSQSPITTTAFQIPIVLPNARRFVWTASSRDDAGNWSAESVLGLDNKYPFIEIDTLAPSAVSSTGFPEFPANPQSLNPDIEQLIFKFQPSSSTDGISYELEVVLDSATDVVVFRTSCPLVNGTNCYLVDADTVGIKGAGGVLGDDRYRWHVRAVDSVGNTSAWTPSSLASAPVFTLDRMPPPSPILVFPTPNRYLTSALVSLDWDASPGASGYELYLEILSAGAWTPVTGYNPYATTATNKLTTLPTDNSRYRFRVVATDAASNRSPASENWEFNLDATKPPTLRLEGVDAANRSARLFWNTVAEGEGGSGIVSYQLCYGETSPPANCTANTVAAPANDGLIRDLLNKRDYYFGVKAVDLAGNTGLMSNIVSMPVGWQRTFVPLLTAYPIQPLGIAVRGREIYITFMEKDADEGQPTGNFRVAVSRDGGTTWSIVTLDSYFAWGRNVGPIGFTNTAVVAATNGTTQDLPGRPGYGPLRIWQSTNQGVSFSNTYSAGSSAWMADNGLGFTTSGGAVSAFYQDGNLANTAQTIQLVSDTDNGATPSRYGMFYDPDGTTERSDLQACAANYQRFIFYKQFEPPFSESIRMIASNFEGSTDFSGSAVDGLVSTISPASTFMGYIAVACASQPGAPHLYVARLYEQFGATKIYFNRSLDGGVTWGSWTNIRGTVNVGMRPAMWAAGDNVYILFRSGSVRYFTSPEVLTLGESTDSGATWTWTELDSNEFDGRYPVMTGTVTSDVHLAFTDAEGSTLSYMRPAVDAVHLRPVPGIGTAAVVWDEVDDVTRYRIDYGATDLSSSTYTSTPIHAATDLQNLAVWPLDAEGLRGNDGERWRIAPFIEETVCSNTDTTIATNLLGSESADLATNYVAGSKDHVVVLPPYPMRGDADVDLALWRSTNGGDTFSKQDLGLTSCPARLRAMADTGAGLAVVFACGSTTLRGRYWADMGTATDASNNVDATVYGTTEIDLRSGVTMNSTYDRIAIGADQGTQRVLVAISDYSTDEIDFLWSIDGGQSYLQRGAITIPDGTTEHVSALTVGPIAAPNAVVAWVQGNADVRRVYYIRTTDYALSWTAPEQLHFGTPNNMLVDDATRLQVTSNVGHTLVTHVTRGSPANLYTTVTGPILHTSDRYHLTKMYLDRQEIATDTFAALSGPNGHFIAYKSAPIVTGDRTSPELSRLALAYCYSDCQVFSNWVRRSVKVFDPWQEFDVRGLSISQQPVTDELFISYTYYTGSAYQLRLLRGGVIERLK